MAKAKSSKKGKLPPWLIKDKKLDDKKGKQGLGTHEGGESKAFKAKEKKTEAMHKMPGGMMMSDKQMKKKMKK